MKTVLLAALTTFCLPSISHALVREIALCQTADGRYQVSVQDNEGLGGGRASHVIASVQDVNGNVVATYEAELHSGVQSVSFGRTIYQDVSTTDRHAFNLQGSSTNFKNYVLNVQMNAGGQTGTIADQNLSCSIFGGIVLN